MHVRVDHGWQTRRNVCTLFVVEGGAERTEARTARSHGAFFGVQSRLGFRDGVLHVGVALPTPVRMTSVRTWFLLFVSCFVLAFVPGCQKYDQLVDKDENCNAKWGDYEADLQRRADLVPNLVATVKASAKHEESVLTQVTQARAEATSIKLSADDLTDPAKVAAFEKAQENLKGSLSRLLVANEAYPDLKANAAYAGLQVQLEGTENRLLRSRQQYNEAVRDYNSELRRIGGSVVNKATGKTFQPRVYFEASAASKEAPKVNFDDAPAAKDPAK